MANRSEAYDFSYFEDRNAVIDDYAYQQPQIEEQPRENVVELPQQQPEHQPDQGRKPRHNFLRAVKNLIVIALVSGVAMTAVFSEVQLTELNEQISNTRNALAEAESLEIQLTMQATQRMSDAEVEAYAVEQLGMGKLSGSQVVYLHVAQQDRGTVVQDIEDGSWLDQVFAEVRSWFAG